MLDCPVPTRYLQAVPIKEGKEFTHMRYTAATCDPADFASEGYTLRQQLLERHTELFIVLTMYNVRNHCGQESARVCVRNSGLTGGGAM